MNVGSLLTADNLVALLTLALLEIVLGIDNLVFISILTGRLPKEQQKASRQIGLGAALVTRLMLLFSLSWIASLTRPLFTIPFIHVEGEPWAATGESIVLLIGGLFLLWKSVSEIYHKVELKDEGVRDTKAPSAFWKVIANIALMDIIFSLDSVITAVGMARQLWVMVGGVIIAMIVMVMFADSVANFINKYASLKILALAFLLMIGTLLVAQAVGYEIPKGFVYFAMFFSLGVELIQIRYEANLERHDTETARV
jgi:predicted tellurium resistance membrane protein TerC